MNIPAETADLEQTIFRQWYAKASIATRLRYWTDQAAANQRSAKGDHMSKFVVTHFETTLADSLCKAAGIPPETVRRLVLDLTAGKPGILHLETFADDTILRVDATGTGIEVKRAKELA